VDKGAPVISGVETTTQSKVVGDSIVVFEGVSAALPGGADVSSTLEAQVVYMDGSGNETVERDFSVTVDGANAEFTFTQSGTYIITYRATNNEGAQTSSVTATYQVEDPMVP
jgi:hypothetical protein